jgi:serine/threonine protein kinase
MAPEILENQPFEKESDVYSFGTIMWEMLSWEKPWKEIEEIEELRSKKKNEDLLVPDEKDWDSLPGPKPNNSETLPGFTKLAQQCLSRDPNHRPLFPEIFDRLKKLEDLEKPPEFPSGPKVVVRPRRDI